MSVQHISADSSTSTINLTTHNQYHSPRITLTNLHKNPLTQFKTWFTEALTPPNPSIPKVIEPEAVCLSTSTSTGIPSSRFVLLKTVDDKGFVIFTNYSSRKSREILENPYASLAFYWKEVSRSVRVIGKVEKVDREDTERYFQTRPRGSQVGAWASEQSKVVGEDELEERVREFENRFEGEVPCPDHWGGWRIVPFEIEFWAGQPSRLHDRFRYTRPKDGGEWEINRLAP